jgi:hypothetical protein
MLCDFCKKIFHGRPSMGLLTEGYSPQYQPHSNGANIQISAAELCQICCLLLDQMNVYSLSGQYHWAAELLKATTDYFLATESVPAAESPLYVVSFRITWGTQARTTFPVGIMPCMLSVTQKRVEAADVGQCRRGTSMARINYPNKRKLLCKGKANFILAL